MRILFSSLSLAISANGETCKDLCIHHLGTSKCLETYCKHNGVCHALHWTGKNKKEVTVDPRADQYGIVVKCSEVDDFFARYKTLRQQQTTTTPRPMPLGTVNEDPIDWILAFI
jgi:hypothetical protein